jgi:hypothetical protein
MISQLRRLPHCSKDGNVTVDLSAMTLRNTLSDPDDVSDLLLFEFNVGVKGAKLKLVHEGVLHQLHL